MSAPSIAKTVHKASDFMIEALEEGGGFALLCFGKEFCLGTKNEREFFPFISGEITPKDMLKFAISMLGQAQSRLYFLGRDRLLNEDEQRLAKDVRMLLCDLEYFLEGRAAA